ncbi:uncharacterized protein LOC133717621 [Rosa rugosa]|uniref:uncharacterized protein LOC133717621 n=1 Tax=Rosa rugosa TaxID=74645 RepID=UPI002B40481C|nr:uncharacterized protein LOC133717621 [Rosa rugosa]
MGSSGGALRKNQILLHSLDFGFYRFEDFLFLLYVINRKLLSIYVIKEHLKFLYIGRGNFSSKMIDLAMKTTSNSSPTTLDRSRPSLHSCSYLKNASYVYFDSNYLKFDKFDDLCPLALVKEIALEGRTSSCNELKVVTFGSRNTRKLRC